jgi:hypothetical protein
MSAAATLLPRRARGRPSPNAEAAYQEQRQAFCALIEEIRSTRDLRRIINEMLP